MSKRARITLNLDPEPVSEPAMTAKPELEPKPEPEPKAATAAKPKPKPDPISEPAGVTAAKTKPKPEPLGQTRVASSPAEPRVRSEAATAAQPHFEPAAAAGGGLNLGTVIKVALVGLVVVSAILWLKRKP